MNKIRLLSVCLLLLSFLATRAQVDAQAKHPLDSLTGQEITAAVVAIKAHADFPKAGMFSTVQLHEPPKDVVTKFRPGTAFPREAFSIVFDRVGNRTFETVVDLRTGRVTSWKLIPGVQPLVFSSEYGVVDELVREDERWKSAMRKRGIKDLSEVAIDGWAVGHVDPKHGGRLLRGLSYYKGKNANYYGRPIEGVVAIVNMNTRTVVEVTDTGVVPISATSQDFDEASVGQLREKPKPLEIKHPAGAGYRLNGQEVSWQKWNFRYTMHPREGLVLHTVGYEDGGKLRPILYRASLSEMVVPYGDPDGNWAWRAAFDVGEYAVGRLASPLEKNLDAPENAQLLDAVFADDDGEPTTLAGAVAIYERDGGLLWKHFDSVTGKNESRRARELVMSFVATIGNYDYAVNYIFKQDGSIEVDLALTGIMLAKGVPEKTVSADHHSNSGATGHLVAENIAAPNHQHFFSFRLDFDVDGVSNSVTELNTAAMPAGSSNALGNGFVMRETILRSEGDARRMMDMQSARVWSVVNPASKNALGQPASFILIPGGNSLPYIAPDSSVRQRAQFINHHFWATRNSNGELYSAGTYPNQSKGGGGLPQFVANNEPLENQDVVVWYTLGVTHVPRPEEWPVMPVTHTGFKLVPAGFFNRNPALDVPR